MSAATIRLFALALIALFAFCATAQAARMSGAYLYRVCDMDAQGRETIKGGHAACQSYIAGVLDYHSVLQSMKIAPSVNICVPQKTTLRDLQDIVLNFLRTHKEHDGFVAAPAVTMALFQVFPCGKKKK